MNRIAAFISGNRKRALTVALAVLGIVLIIFSCRDDGATEATTDLAEYKRSLESELEDMLSHAEGVGRCRVTVTFSEGESSEYRGTKIISTSPPRVMGVSVVCEGGGSDDVSARITDSLCAMFDIGANRVCILKMKK